MNTRPFQLIVRLILVPVLISISSSRVYCNEQNDEKNYVPNEVLVKFVCGTMENDKEAVRQSLGAKKVKLIKSIQVEYWKLPEDITTEDAIELLNNLPTVEYAEPNYLYKPQAVPNDTHFDKLWFLQNTGQGVNGTVGEVGADISATDAWDIETGSHDVVIGVIDSGVAYDHPDLINNVWTNEDEIPNNGIDDDNNGFIDDVHGWDFVNDDNNPSDYSKDMYGDGHGTHVAGTITARGNNSTGITGVMWQAQIMPLQIFDLFKTNSFLEGIIQLIRIISAIDYAVDNGAKIINCSFGGPLYSQFQCDACNYAHQNGVLVVVSAGNENKNNDVNPSYPASYDLPNIISVAATNELDELALYSNYGLQTVDVAAPGGSGLAPNIYSTTPPERITLFYDDFESGGSKWVTTGNYENWSIGYNAIFGSKVIKDSLYYYSSNEDSYLRMAYPVNATNCRGVHFEYKVDYALEENYDFLYVEGSLDGINYFTLRHYTGFFYDTYKEWYSELELGQFYIGFRLVSDNLYNYDGVYIDDIILTGIPWEFDGDEYDYKSGTSMAAPVVSGIAGLIWSYDPTLTHLEVKDAVLNSVDQLSSLNGKVLNGGRVNAYKALLYLQNPPSVVTGGVMSITSISAKLWGTVNPNGTSTTYYFEYGTTTDYGSTTLDVSAGSGTDAVIVTADISELDPETIYHFRLVATNDASMTTGTDCTFTTTATLYTGEELDQAVANAEATKDVVIAQKDQTISDLNTTIASMFTQEQLDQAVANATASLFTQEQVDQAIAEATANLYTQEQLDQAVSDAVANATANMFSQEQVDQAILNERMKYDPNCDGVIGMDNVIYYLQVLSGVRLNN